MMKIIFAVFLAFAFTLQSAVCAGFAPVKTHGDYGSQTASMPFMQGSIAVNATDTSYFTLTIGVLSLGGGATYYPFRRNGAIYQVPVSKTCRCEQIRYRVSSASGGFQLMYDTVTFADATANGTLTAPVRQSGSNANYAMSGGITGNAVVTEGFIYSFPASSFPGAQMSDNTQIYQIYLTCREI